MFNSAIFIRLLTLSRLLDFQSVFCLFIYGFILFYFIFTSDRIVENGQERVEVVEDGQLKSLTVNGKEQLLRLDNK